MGPEELSVLPSGTFESMLCVFTVAGAGHKNLPAQRCHVKQLETSLHEGCFLGAAGGAGGSRHHGAVINPAANRDRKRADGIW